MQVSEWSVQGQLMGSVHRTAVIWHGLLLTVGEMERQHTLSWLSVGWEGNSGS